MKKVIGINGSYRQNGITEKLMDIMLNALSKKGIAVEKITLRNQDIHFCTNCRVCTQEPGQKRGKCPIKDDMEAILNEIERADGIILGSPMNFSTITAVTKAFKERLLGYYYWSWGTRSAPKLRKATSGKAVLLYSCVMPVFISNLITRISKELKETAELLGFEPVGFVKAGIIGIEKHEEIPDKLKRKSERLVKKLLIS